MEGPSGEGFPFFPLSLSFPSTIVSPFSKLSPLPFLYHLHCSKLLRVVPKSRGFGDHQRNLRQSPSRYICYIMVPGNTSRGIGVARGCRHHSGKIKFRRNLQGKLNAPRAYQVYHPGRASHFLLCKGRFVGGNGSFSSFCSFRQFSRVTTKKGCQLLEEKCTPRKIMATRTCAIPEHLRGVFTTMRYTNTRLPLPVPNSHHVSR